jgi:hypothetical protein
MCSYAEGLRLDPQHHNKQINNTMFGIEKGQLEAYSDTVLDFKRLE